jgi:hypothetical protein
MSGITRYNYEAYLLDYLEQNLSAEQILELTLFFEIHPELSEDLEAFEIHELIPPKMELMNKTELKNEEELISLFNYEDFLIAEIEALNPAETSKELLLFLKKNPRLYKEYVTYQQTKLLASTVFFEAKETLFKKERKVIPLYWWSSVAAATLVAFFWLQGRNDVVENPYISFANMEVALPEIEQKETLKSARIESENKEITFAKKHSPPVAIALKKKIVPSAPEKGLKEKALEEPVPNQQDITGVLLAEASIEKKNEEDAISKELIPEDQEDAVLLAENNVVITYEDEVSVPVKKKMTKLTMIRKVIKQQVKAKLFDRGREGILLVVNSKPANFIRGKNKK